MTARFDPAQHRRFQNRWFEDFAPGERFICDTVSIPNLLAIPR